MKEIIIVHPTILHNFILLTDGKIVCGYEFKVSTAVMKGLINP